MTVRRADVRSRRKAPPQALFDRRSRRLAERDIHLGVFMHVEDVREPNA